MINKIFNTGSSGQESSDSRAVSPVIAVALLILISLGFVSGLQTAGSGLINGIEQPPNTNIKVEQEQNWVRFSVIWSSNTDRLEVRVDGQEITDANGNPALGGTTGSTARLDWSGDPNAPGIDVSSEVVEGSSLITIVAFDGPDNSILALSYEVPG